MYDDNTYNAAQLIYYLGLLTQQIITNSGNNEDYSMH